MTEVDDVCGETIDHDAVLRDDRDGIKVYDCRRCGAEIIEEDEESA